MEKEMLSLLIEKIKDAELVLIGIGEECAIGQAEWKKMPGYQKCIGAMEENSPFISFVKKILLEAGGESIESKKILYQKLAELVKDKNYFVVSLCSDGLVKQCGFDSSRVVEPCGNFNYLQCSEKCTDELYEPDSALMNQIKNLTLDFVSDDTINLPVCPKCGQPLVFNQVSETGSNYVEEGYLKQWQIYTKWLQGTVNRRVCILELGVGMQFPTVIRWPFEKVAFFNQKAAFFRVHSRLYQVTEEIKERSYGIQASLEDFVKELSNRL